MQPKRAVFGDSSISKMIPQEMRNATGDHKNADRLEAMKKLFRESWERDDDPENCGWENGRSTILSPS